MSNFITDVSWETIIRNVNITWDSENAPTHIYTCTTEPINPNDKGSGELVVGYYLVDYLGNVFMVTDIDGYNITVWDINEGAQNNELYTAPYQDQIGFIYKQKKDGTIYMSQSDLRRLDQSARDLINQMDNNMVDVKIDDYDVPWEKVVNDSGYTLLDWSSDTQSAGRIWGGNITVNLPADGTVHITAGAGLIKDGSGTPESCPCIDGPNSPVLSKLIYIEWDEVPSLTLTNNAYNYIYYDGDDGLIKTTTNFYSIDFLNALTIGRAYRTGNTVIARVCGTNIWNFNRRVQLFGEERFPVERTTGLIMSDQGDRQFSVTAGIIWAELVNRFVVDGKLAATNFTYWYRNGSGGWNTTTTNQINNTGYDNNAGAPTAFGGGENRWRTDWVYAVHDSTYHVVMGQQQTANLTAAETVSPPSPIPGLLAAYASFLGRIIIQKNTTPLYITSAFTTFLGYSAITNHNDLGGLQGGTAGEYFHITSAQESGLANMANWNTAYGWGNHASAGYLKPVNGVLEVPVGAGPGVTITAPDTGNYMVGVSSQGTGTAFLSSPSGDIYTFGVEFLMGSTKLIYGVDRGYASEFLIDSEGSNFAQHLRIKGGDYPGTGNGGNLILHGGQGSNLTYRGGHVYIYGGPGVSSAVRGDVFFGDGTAGYLPGSGTGTSVVLYNRTTGQLSYGDMGGGSSYTFQHSLTESTGTVNLVNDSASPGNSKLYGTNGSGTKGWYDIPTIGGSNTQVQYNNSGVFGGSSKFTWNETNGVLTVNNQIHAPLGTNLILKGGDASGGNAGAIYLIPGVHATNASYIYLGGSGFSKSSIILTTEGTNTNIGLAVETKGTGSLLLGKGAAITSINGLNLSLQTNGLMECIGPNILFNTNMVQFGFSEFYENTILTAGEGSASQTYGLNVTLKGGNGYTTGNTNGGSLYLYGGAPNGSGLRGDIFFGDGSNGYLPAKSSETNVVYYNTTTGKLSYGTVSGGSAVETFETVSGNHKAYPYDLTYGVDGIATITYDLGGGDFIVKTFNYTGGRLTSIVLSGDIPSGIDTTKTFTYTGSDLTSVAYS